MRRYPIDEAIQSVEKFRDAAGRCSFGQQGNVAPRGVASQRNRKPRSSEDPNLIAFTDQSPEEGRIVGMKFRIAVAAMSPDDHCPCRSRHGRTRAWVRGIDQRILHRPGQANFIAKP